MAMLVAQGYRLGTRRTYANIAEDEGRNQGDAESIMVDPNSGTRLGANDPRSADSAAVGY
jgi:hypothetical protein